MESPKRENVYIIGAQSTGKTTVVRELEALFHDEQVSDSRKMNETGKNTSALESRSSATDEVVKKPAFITELARTVLQTQNVTRDTMTSKADVALAVQHRIMEAQYQAESDILKSEPGAWFVSDRSALDTVVYATEFAGSEAAETLLASPRWAELEERMRQSIVFVCEAGNTDWLLDDGVRYMPRDSSHWDKIDRMFRTLLQERGIKYSIIPRHVTDRRRRATIVLEAMGKSRARLDNCSRN